MKLSYILGLILIYSSTFAQKPNLEDSVEELRQLMVSPTKDGLTSIAHYKLSYGHSLGKIENRDQYVEALVSGKTGFTEIVLAIRPPKPLEIQLLYVMISMQKR